MTPHSAVGSWGIWSSPALGPDGTIYFTSSDNLLYALNPGGTKKWTYDGAGGNGSQFSSTPAMRVWQEGGEFARRVAEDPEIPQYLTAAELTELFDRKHYTRQVDRIFARVFGGE